MFDFLIPYLKLLGIFFDWHVLLPALLVGIGVFIVTYCIGRKEMEQYPEGWVRLELMINSKTKEIHIISGDREGHDPESDCDSDAPYIGMKVLKSMICTCDSENVKCNKCGNKNEVHSDDPSDIGC